MEDSPASPPSALEVDESKYGVNKVRGRDEIDLLVSKDDPSRTVTDADPLPVRRSLDFSNGMDQTPDQLLETQVQPPASGGKKRYYAPIPKPLAFSFCYTLNQNKQLVIGLDSENKYETKIHIHKLDSPRNAVTITRADWTFIKSKLHEITSLFAEGVFQPCSSPTGKLHLQMESEGYYSPCLMLAHDSISLILLQFSTWRIFLRLVPVIDAHLKYNESLEEAFTPDGAQDEINSFKLNINNYIQLLREIKLSFKPTENVKQKNTYVIRRVVAECG